MFHKVKIGLRKAFSIIFEMSATTRSMSARQMAKRYDVSYSTAWLFMHKVCKPIKSSELNPISGKIIEDVFVFGSKENLKQGRSTNRKKRKF